MIERRTFIQLAALGLTDLLMGGPISCASVSDKTPSATPYGATANGPKGKVVFCLNLDRPGECTLRVFDWDDHSFEDFTVPMGVIHSVVQDGKNPSVLYLFELLGSGGRLDLATKSFVKIDHRESREMFNGHGALSRSGEFVAATEVDADQSSTVTFRSSKDLKKVRRVAKECNFSHQVAGLPDSSLMVAGVMRGYDGKAETGAITFFDGESGRIANRIDFPLPVLHVMPLSSTEVIGVSFASSLSHEMKPKISSAQSASENIAVLNSKMTFLPGPLYYASLDGKKKIFWDEKDKALFTYNFGLAKINGHRFLSGHHDSGKVVLWEDLAIKKVVSVPFVKNLLVSRDGTEFIALSGPKAVAYSLETFERKSTLDGWPDVMSFSSYSVT